MKFILPLLLLCSLVQAQNKHAGYAYIGATSFFSQKLNNYGGIGVGVGYSPNSHFAFGGGGNLFLFNPKFEFAQAFVDIREYFSGLNKKTSPFISIQPGFVIYKTTVNGTEKITGSFAINAVAGIMIRLQKSIGIYFDAGYSNISFADNGTKTSYGGIKIEGGISFLIFN
jgi:hypothetical protein